MCVQDAEKDMDNTSTNSWPLQCHLLLPSHMDKKISFLTTSAHDTTNTTLQSSIPVSNSIPLSLFLVGDGNTFSQAQLCFTWQESCLLLISSYLCCSFGRHGFSEFDIGLYLMPFINDFTLPWWERIS